MVTIKADMDMRFLANLFKLAPRETRRQTARLLNDEAFTFRENAPDILGKKYHIRNKSFVRSRFWVDKASSSQTPNSQAATVGSVPTSRFTGWIEPVTGQEPERNRLLGATARGGDYSKQARQENRLLPGKEFESPDNYSEIPERMRVPAMLSIPARNPDYTADGKGMFLLWGGNWVPGLYKFKKGQQARWIKSKKKGLHLSSRDRATYERPKVTRIQTLGKAPESERYDWPGITIQRVRTWFDHTREGERILKAIFDSIKRAK